MNTKLKHTEIAFRFAIVQWGFVLLGVLVYIQFPIFIIIWIEFFILMLAFIFSMLSLIQILKGWKENFGLKKWFSLVTSVILSLLFILCNISLFTNL